MTWLYRGDTLSNQQGGNLKNTEEGMRSETEQENTINETAINSVLKRANAIKRGYRTIKVSTTMQQLTEQQLCQTRTVYVKLYQKTTHAAKWQISLKAEHQWMIYSNTEINVIQVTGGWYQSTMTQRIRRSTYIQLVSFVRNNKWFLLFSWYTSITNLLVSDCNYYLSINYYLSMLPNAISRGWGVGRALVKQARWC